MFDEQEEKLLQIQLKKIKRQYSKVCQVYEISAFDTKFDKQLCQLVTYYNFDFEAIAIHLHFKFPQYTYKLKAQAVAYRWHQLVLERQKQRITELMTIQNEEGKTQVNLLSETDLKIKNNQQKQDQIHDIKMDLKLKYQTALKMAQVLDEQEQESFMFYKPKFIIDTEYKLERQADNLAQFSALLENQYIYNFGNFQAPIAGIINLDHLDEIKAAPPQMVDSRAEDQTKYLDEDWEAYESD